MIYLKTRDYFRTQGIEPSANEIGEKAIGLLALPELWTPPYVILTTGFFLEWDNNSIQNIADYEPLNATLIILKEELIELKTNGYGKVIVRSSAAVETMEDRGNYESKECNNELTQVLETIEKIFLDSSEFLRLKGKNKLALIIQGYVNPKYSGHLSNERRIAKKLNFWSIEYINHITNQSDAETTNVLNASKALDSNSILCSNKNEFIENLKSLGFGTYLNKERSHYEWIWDGSQLWIVQKDIELSLKGTKPGSEWKFKDVDIKTENLKVLKVHRECLDKWDKVVKSQSFEKCNLPSVNIYVLEDKHTIQALLDNQETKELDEDLQLLANYPIVIRTSLRESDTINHSLYLPRTDTIFTWEEAKFFLIQTSKKFISSENLLSKDFAFLIHHFIVSKSCALAYTKPEMDKVKIDSSWGLADGLAYNSYDSFEVDLKRNQVKKRIRGKHEYLDINAKGEWIIKKSGSNWDWKNSLENQEVLVIAKMSYEISNFFAKPLIIMFFINYENSKIHPHILPWYLMNEIPLFSETISEKMFTRKKINISTRDDLDFLKKRNQKGYYKNDKVTIQLKLDPSIIRDYEFIKEIATIAKENDFHLEIEGSVLSHAFYIFSSTGVKLRCDDLFEPRSDRQLFNKLVRDKIPEKISSHGESSITSKIPPRILMQLLKAKAVEEALELNSAKHTTNLLEELADLLEIIRSLGNIISVPFSEIHKLADKKREERGGFEEGIYLRETEEISLTSLGSSTSTHPQRINIRTLRGQKAKIEGSKIILSLIPSAVKTEPYILFLKDSKKHLIIKYKNKEIELSIEDEIVDENPNQLHFEF